MPGVAIDLKIIISIADADELVVYRDLLTKVAGHVDVAPSPLNASGGSIYYTPTHYQTWIVVVPGS
ncbi:hypothetical protein [Kutzneria sp. CA-103260]|uniref:hypothetical protein n=1 Tax=Kutzneria sp. CA-103260 TaxID=2802641 RepID=UPI001BA851CB|nr:hypothetical protein [Kutzneria sp. CA-103260]QUQ68315.1 hypothetical protein JJ691_60600 [Kutzneria sp. CA-103260]